VEVGGRGRGVAGNIFKEKGSELFNWGRIGHKGVERNKLMRNVHTWKHTTEEGSKREVRAEKFGKRWRVQAKLKPDAGWTYYDDPLVADLIELRDVLFRKYQRKHLSYDDLAAVEKMITDRGATWVKVDEEEG
jgi:hypothetical protein